LPRRGQAWARAPAPGERGACADFADDDEHRLSIVLEEVAASGACMNGVTEPDAGLDTTAIGTRAVLDGASYVVHGRKARTSKALESDKVLLLVRTTPLEQVARPTDGMTLLVADLKDPAVHISAIPKLGRNAVVSCEVVYDGLRVPEGDRVGEEGRGFRFLLDGLNAERVLVAAEALGTGRAALRRAVAYACERVVFGRPIGATQGISFPLADAHARLHAAGLVVREAAWRIDRGLPAGEQADAAKFLAAEAAFAAARRLTARPAR
jgi:acyl-CoA dehydrogenase